MTIQSVKRALDILSLFTPSQPILGITEIAVQMGLPKPTAHGLVQTLADEGFLTQSNETRRYSLGLRVYELGTFVSTHLRVNQVGGGFVQRLAREMDLMARIAIWDRGEVLVTLNSFPTAQLLPYVHLGPKVPAYCSATGKAILSTWSEGAQAAYFAKTELLPLTQHTCTENGRLKEELRVAASTGYASESEECLMGLACIGVPLFDHTGSCSAAISVSGGPELMAREALPQIISEVKRTAGEISYSMGYIPLLGKGNIRKGVTI